MVWNFILCLSARQLSRCPFIPVEQVHPYFSKEMPWLPDFFIAARLFPVPLKGGNPAVVWIGDVLPAPQEMQKIAADVGSSETAFVTPASGEESTARYFSPEVEVPFCGHATVAAGFCTVAP